MKNIINIIKLDLVTMNAKKISLGKVFIFAFFVSVIVGLLFPPFLVLFALAFGMIAVPAFIDTEDKHEGGMTFAVLPVTRRENVIARYGLITSALTITGATLLIVLRLSLLLDFSRFFESTSQVNESLSDVLNLKIDDFGLFSMLVCIIIACSLIFSASQLGSFFKTGRNQGGKSALRFVLIMFVIWLVIGAVLIFETSTIEIKIISTFLKIISELFISLSSPFNGLLLNTFFLIIAYGFVIFKAACSVIDYETREL